MIKPLKDERSSWSVFLIFLRLGLTSFGGPIAHIGYFRDEFVARRHWLTERSYADLVALCQFLPGPASSQLGMALGLSHAGYAGAFAAWLGFTLPSALALILFALGIANYQEVISSGVIAGLKIAAIAVVAQALWGMGRNLCSGIQRISLLGFSTCVALMIPSLQGQLIVIVTSALAGLLFLQTPSLSRSDPLPITISPIASIVWCLLFVLLLILLPILAASFPNTTLSLVDSFYRSGALVFGGGHVVLPLLQTEVVPSGLVSSDTFLAGYGAAQAVPGPLFTFAAFLGASLNGSPSGWVGGLICLFAIFIPSWFLITGVLPFWERIRCNAHCQAALSGINSGVVGLLLAAFYQPIWTSSIHGPKDFGLAVLALIALMFWKLPPWLVVLLCGIMGWLLTLSL